MVPTFLHIFSFSQFYVICEQHGLMTAHLQVLVCAGGLEGEQCQRTGEAGRGLAL